MNNANGCVINGMFVVLALYVKISDKINILVSDRDILK